MDMTADHPAALEKLQAYFDQVLGEAAGAPRRATIAVPLTWPEIRNAEYEVIKRFCNAAERIGSRIIVTDNNGYPVWSSDDAPVDKTRQLGPDDVDFMISLHFESPRLIDVPSYYAIWQPVDFYFDFGYEPSVAKLLTHSDGLSCSADPSDAHFQALMASCGRNRPGHLPYLFHSPSGPYFEPKITEESRLFYIGINWERLGQSKKGRFHELLRLLDDEKLIDIYGPRTFLGAKPWEGYDCYRGELPFDGKSVVRALHNSGICLAMSSKAHQDSGVMSNRLFEGLAAGTAIIANPHPFIDKYFSDLVYQVDDTVGDEEIFFQITDIITEIRADPEAANERARKGQERLRDLFSLEKCLQALIAQHPARTAARRGPDAAPITVIFPYAGQRLSAVREVLEDLKAQAGVAIELVLVWDPVFAEGAGKALIEAAQAHFPRVTVITDVFHQDALQPTLGAALHAARGHVTTEAFAVVSTGERFFRDHFRSLAQALTVPGGRARVLAAASGQLDEDYEGTKRDLFVRRKVAGLNMPSDPRDVLVNSDLWRTPGRYLFSAGLLTSAGAEVLPLLDDGATGYLLLQTLIGGRVAQTGEAGYVRIIPDAVTRMPSAQRIARQQQFLRDTLRFDPLPGLPPVPPVTGTGLNGDLAVAPFVPRIFLDEMMDVRTGSAALQYLDTGFSHPEAGGIWIDGGVGTLRFRVANAGKIEDMQIALMLAGRPALADNRPQHVTVAVNGMTLGYFQLSAQPVAITVRLPVGLAKAEVLQVRIIADHAEPVRNAEGAIVDPRRLGILLTGVGIFRSAKVPLPELAPDLDYDLRRTGNGRPLLVEGCFPEEELTWLSDGPALLRFRIRERMPKMRLDMDLIAISSETEHEPIELTCKINDMPVARFKVGDRMSTHVIPLPAEAMGDMGNCELTLEPSHAVRMYGGNRILSVGLRRLRLSNLDPIEPDVEYLTTSSGNGKSFLREGFSKIEPVATWIDGEKARIEGRLEPGEFSGEAMHLEIRAGSRAAADGELHRCRVMLNGEELGTITLDPVKVITARLPLPPTFVTDKEADLRIGLELEDPALPVMDPVTKKVLDPRRLGMNLVAFRLATGEIQPEPEADLAADADQTEEDGDEPAKATKGRTEDAGSAKATKGRRTSRAGRVSGHTNSGPVSSGPVSASDKES